MSVTERLRKYILLNIFAMVGMSCYILADTYFISLAEGADGITALNLVLPVYSLIFAIGSMLGTGSATRYAIYKASGNKSADLYFSNAVCWALMISAVFMLPGIFCPGMVMKVMGADAGITAVGESYIRIVLLFSPCFMLNYIFTSFVRNDQAPSLAMAATLISSFSNIVLDYIFMFPLKMGMAGAALATGLSPVISIGICCIHLLSSKSRIRFLRRMPSGRRLVQSCQLGVAAFVGEMSSGITTTVFNFLLLGIAGNTGVAAYAVIANLALVGISIFNGIAQGVQPLASEAYGKRDADANRKILKIALTVSVAVSLAMIVVMNVFAGQVTAVFNHENSRQLEEYAVMGIRIYFTGFLFAGINVVGTGFLSATERAKEAFVIAILRGMAAISFFAFVLSRLLGINGVWLAFPAAEAVSMLVTLTAVRPLLKK